MTRDEFIDRFAEWLLSAGHATTTQDADRKAWDFVVPAWDGDDDLDNWKAAYDEALQEGIVRA